MAPGATVTCSATYTVTQANLDAGTLNNSATAHITVAAKPASSADTNSIPAVREGDQPCHRHRKDTARCGCEHDTDVTNGKRHTVPCVYHGQVRPIDKTGPANFGTLGQTITYGFSITNQTAQTLAGVVVTEPRIPALSCTRTNIAPFGLATCSGTNVVTQADLDAGVINNNTSAVGTAPDGSTFNRADTVAIPINPASANKSMTLHKQASVTTFSAVGNLSTYIFEVRNAGNLTQQAKWCPARPKPGDAGGQDRIRWHWAIWRSWRDRELYVCGDQ